MSENVNAESKSDAKKVHRQPRAGIFYTPYFYTVYDTPMSYKSLLIFLHIVIGRKAEKKKNKTKHDETLPPEKRNPKAFAINSVIRAERKFRRYSRFRFTSLREPSKKSH